MDSAKVEEEVMEVMEYIVGVRKEVLEVEE